MTPSELSYEIGTKAPNPRARPNADFLAQAAFRHWPQNPRAFAWLQYAVVDRETNWHNILGDNGHGYGYSQVDDRSHAEWLAANQNGLDPATNLDKGAEILAAGLKAFAPALEAGICCYNCGPAGVKKGLASTPPDPNAHTTGHDYGKDVLRRFAAAKPVDCLFSF